MNAEQFVAVLDCFYFGAYPREAFAEVGVTEREFRAYVREQRNAREEYYAAQAASIDAQVDRMLEIADDMAVPAEHKRIQLEQRRWLAERLRPERFGAKIVFDPATANAVSLTINVSKVPLPREAIDGTALEESAQPLLASEAGGGP